VLSRRPSSRAKSPMGTRRTGSSLPPPLRPRNSPAPGEAGGGDTAAVSPRRRAAPTLQLKGLATRLFPADKEAEADSLVATRLPSDLADASKLVRKLQGALDENLQQRRRLVESASEIERSLVLERSDTRGREHHLAEQVEELTVVCAQLKEEKNAAVSAVEKRWRDKVDADAVRFRVAMDEAREKGEAKEKETAQLLYVNMTNERRIAELTTKFSESSAVSHVESAELASIKQRRSEDVGRLQAQVARLTGVLEAKSNEVSTAMVTFAEMQRMTAEREGELKQRVALAEAKYEEVQVILAEEREQGLSNKHQLMAAYSDLNSLKDKLSEARRQAVSLPGADPAGAAASELTELQAQLKVELSLKERAERREEAERQERIATYAQLVAVEAAKAKALEQARKDFEKREKKLIMERDEYCDRASALQTSAKEYKEMCERVEAEKRVLQRGLERVHKQMKNVQHRCGGDGQSDTETEPSDSDVGTSSGGRRVGFFGRLRGRGRGPIDRSPVRGAANHQSAELAARPPLPPNAELSDPGPRAPSGEAGAATEDARGAAALAAAEGLAAAAGCSSTPTSALSLAAEEEAELRRKTTLTAELEAAQREASEASAAAAESAAEAADLAGENERLKGLMKDLERENIELKTLMGATKKQCRETLADLERRVREGETQRRKMHNLIQELRGNVRVFARVRPFLPSDKAPPEQKPWISVNADGFSLDVLQAPPGQRGAQAQSLAEVSHTFHYDKCFSPGEGQEAMFTEVSEFVQSALDGYNVCLFSYGQTGSGKTHTMQGVGASAMRGIIPRAIEQVHFMRKVQM